MNWFENEEFWSAFFPVMFPAERAAAADKQVAEILALTLPNGRAVLDLCCGPGLHAVAFALRGFDVTGVDLSDFLLNKARQRASDNKVSVRWIHDDMRSFQESQSFDLACNLTTSLGYFEDEDENLRVLRNVYQSLRPGGVFLIDIVGKEVFARNWRPVFRTPQSDGSILTQRSQVLDGWERIRNEWTLVKSKTRYRMIYEHSIYSGRELKNSLLLSDFSSVKLFGDLKGSAYGMDACRLVAVATK
jgi:SAM-dependent methyltransferase